MATKFLGNERLHRQQLDGSDAELLQIIHDGRLRQAQKFAALTLWHRRMQLCETFDMQLINDGVTPRHRRRTVLAPREFGLNHTRLVHVRRAVQSVQLLGRLIRLIAEQRGIPLELARQRTRIRIEQQLVRIVSQAVRGIVWAVHAKAIYDAGHTVRRWQEAMPHVLGAFRQGEAHQLVLAALIEQAQLDARSASSANREVHTVAGPGGAQRRG